MSIQQIDPRNINFDIAPKHEPQRESPGDRYLRERGFRRIGEKPWTDATLEYNSK